MYVWVHLKNKHPIDTQLLDTQSLSTTMEDELTVFEELIEK